MADGTTYSITVDAETIGADATADEINGVADALEAAERVATPFDAALAGAEAQLADAAAASADASSALQVATDSMRALESASVRAGKAVEKQAQLGAKGMGDVAKFRAAKAAAEASAAAVLKQAAAVDRAKVAANSAAGAEKKLAASMRTLKTSANKATAALKSTSSETVRASDAAGMLGGTLGSVIPRIENAWNLFKGMGGGAAIAVVVVLALAVAFVALNVAIGLASISALKFAIANDKIAKARMDTIAERTSKAWKALFSGLDTAPLLNAMDRFSTQFTQSTAAGRALKALMETIVQPFANAIEAVEPIAREMFKGAVLGALKLAIAALSVRNAILRVLPKSVKTAIKELSSDLTVLNVAFKVMEYTLYALAIVFTILGVAAAVVVGAIAMAFVGLVYVLAAPIAIILALVVAFRMGGKAVVDAVKKMVKLAEDALGGLVSAAKAVGRFFGLGLAEGIEGTGASVAAAASLVSAQAVAAAQLKLETDSPSRVMRRMGGFVAEGLAVGMEEGIPEVRTAAEHMTGAVTGEAGAAGGASSTTTIGGASSTRGGNTYHVTIQAPTGDGEDIKAVLDEWFTATLEAEAISLGVGPEPVPT